MRIYIAIVIFLSASYTLSAQEGAPFLSHINESREAENQNWAICQDAYNVMLFANRKGISSFDGQDWSSIRIPVIPYSMRSNPKDGKIFVGGENSYGYLEKNQLGEYIYMPISGDSSGIGVISKIVLNDSVVWFYGEQSISRHNLENNILELRLVSDDNNPFTGMFVTPKNTFVNKKNSGLFRIESDTLFPIVTGYLTKNTDILFCLPYDKTLVLVGMSNGNLSLFDGIKYYDYQIKDDGYLRESILSEGIVIGDSLYAFSTLDGGALVIDKLSGSVRFTINNQNELPDDEIFAIGQDRSGGLWLSHQYGLTRAELNLPVDNFTIYPGLTGNLTTSLWYNGELYVGTSEGLFYLSEVKNYSEVQIYVKKEPVKIEVNQTEESQEQQGTRRNIFQRIFGKKITKDNSNKNLPDTAAKQIPEVVHYTKKTINKLKSINYIYKKVYGFDEKCRQLVKTKNGILAASNKGLMIINNHRALIVAENRYINFISWQPENDRYYIAAGDGYFSVKYEGGKWQIESPDPKFSNPVYSAIMTPGNILWLGVDNAALYTDLSCTSGNVTYKSVSIKNDFPQRYNLEYDNDSLFLFTESGIYYFDKSSEGFVRSRTDLNPAGSKLNYFYPLSNTPWIRHGYDWLYLDTINQSVEKEMSLLKLFNGVVSINTENNVLWVVDIESRLFRIDMNRPLNVNPESSVVVKSIYNASGTAFNLTNVVFKRGDNVVCFDIIAPGYLKQNTTQYQYTIKGMMSDWSPWTVHTNYSLPVPEAGEYILQIRAKDIWGNIGEPETVKFTIKAPFTQTPLFYILIGTFLMLMILLIVRFRESQLQNKNKLLEQKVRERTAEIEAQKEEITSSIEYASRIQMAMLPEEGHFKSHFSEHFVIFKPRDIVSGDFFWIGENEKHIFFTVADCTGHGVPGAFMSSLGISTLNDIIANNDNLHANSVLSLLREKIKTSLHQTGKDGEAADGMDIAFCILNKNKRRLQYSGAYNPMFIFQGNEFKEYKADRMPIGIYYGEDSGFTNYEINVKKGDTVYIFSDGFADQFGGPAGSKYKKANLKKLLSDNQSRSLSEQKTILEEEFKRWKGDVEQIDDVTIVGVRI